MRLAPWLGTPGIFLVDALAAAAKLPPSCLVPAVTTRDIDDGDLPIWNKWGGEPDPPDCPRKIDLIARRKPAGGHVRRVSDEPCSFGPHQRARSLRVPEGRARATADPSGQSHRGAAAASLDAAATPH